MFDYEFVLAPDQFAVRDGVGLPEDLLAYGEVLEVGAIEVSVE